MSLTSAKTEPKPPAPGVWGTILTTTPVILTVLATILAGLSSSEMTQSQYHRSLAAQYQSKAGDQWAFYQAKRIRGSALENSADHLPPAAPLDSDRVRALARRLTVALVESAKASGHSNDAAKRLTEQAESSEKSLDQELGTPEVVQAFTFLTEDKLPAIAEHAIDESLDPALHAIEKRGQCSGAGQFRKADDGERR